MAKLNQNDWIVIGVAGVFGLGVSAYLFFSKPEAQAIPAPAQVNVSKAALPVAGVVMANGLPGGSAAGGLGAGGGKGGAMGMAGGRGGPMGMAGGGGGRGPTSFGAPGVSAPSGAGKPSSGGSKGGM